MLFALTFIFTYIMEFDANVARVYLSGISGCGEHTIARLAKWAGCLKAMSAMMTTTGMAAAGMTAAVRALLEFFSAAVAFGGFVTAVGFLGFIAVAEGREPAGIGLSAKLW